jgi:hydrogenase 3 maturation protease
MRKESGTLPRTAVLGIGSELRGDDAAGIFAARLLMERLPHTEHLLVLDAGPVPENFTGPLRRFQPDLVILIDAAHMGALPGEIRWLDPQDTTGFSASTHSLPLHVFASYLAHELGCEVRLLGIQPANTGFDRELSPEVKTGVHQAVEALIQTLL